MEQHNLIQISAEILRTLRSHSVTGTQYAVLFYLLDAAQSSQWVTVEGEVIAKELGVNVRTVARAIHRLETLGVLDTELLSARWNVQIRPSLFSGQRDPALGQNDPSFGQKDPFSGQRDPALGQNDPSFGQKDPESGSICPSAQRKIKGSRRSPQKGTAATLERDLSLDLKDQKISLLEGECEREILEFITERNPQGRTPAYARTAWKNDRGYWLEKYRQWRAEGDSPAPAPASPAAQPIASPDDVRQQFVGLCTAAAAAGDRHRLATLLQHLRQDYPNLYQSIGFEHPEWVGGGDD